MVLVASEQNWPSRLWLVRHGESAGNVVRAAAEAAGLAMIDIADRDMDVPLSALGKKQALALGRWFARRPESERPTVAFISPYARARQTGALVLDGAGLRDSPTLREVVDERLREKEFGVFHQLTKAGIAQHFPQEQALRDHVGKFYYRPPGGESWCDVILRLRSTIDTIQLQHRGERVLIVAHEVVVLCMRYLLERMTEKQILNIDAAGDVANCSVTEYEFERDETGRGALTLRCYNHVAPLEEAGEKVTDAPDAPAAPR